jgi:hypothetical protein
VPCSARTVSGRTLASRGRLVTQKEMSFDELMPLLIHEMTHAWQTQHGISVVTKTLTALKGGSAYN